MGIFDYITIDHERLTGATTVTGSWRALKGVGVVALSASVTALTGDGMTELRLVAATDASGSNATVITNRTGVADALADTINVEATAAAINAAGKAAGLDFTHYAARVVLDNAADAVDVTHILADNLYTAGGMTPATDIA